MSEIKSFSDYTSKYNSNVDFSAVFSGTSDSSSVGNTNMLSDYAAIKNGSYGKLMKAYYAKQDAEKLSGKGDTSQKLTLMKTSADSLKKSAEKEAEEAEQEKKTGNGVKTDAPVTQKGQRTRGPQKLKFTYQEQRDYETIESEIAALEEKIEMLDQEMAAASTDFVKLNQLVTEKEETEKLLEEKMDRWMYLEDLAAKIAEQ